MLVRRRAVPGEGFSLRLKVALSPHHTIDTCCWLSIPVITAAAFKVPLPRDWSLL